MTPIISPELLYQIISVVLIPIVIWVARKFKLPTQWAPVAAFGVALITVSAARIFGIELDVNTVAQTILAALATAGVAVLGYDTAKGFSDARADAKSGQ
jgi:uncharacterized membrane protein